MKVSFKQFANLIDSPLLEMTDNQLGEALGMDIYAEGFFDQIKKARDVLAQKKDEIEAKKRKTKFDLYKAQRDEREAKAKLANQTGSSQRMQPATPNNASKLNSMSTSDMRAGQLRAVDRNPFGND